MSKNKENEKDPCISYFSCDFPMGWDNAKIIPFEKLPSHVQKSIDSETEINIWNTD